MREKEGLPFYRATFANDGAIAARINVAGAATYDLCVLVTERKVEVDDRPKLAVCARSAHLIVHAAANWPLSRPLYHIYVYRTLVEFYAGCFPADDPARFTFELVAVYDIRFASQRAEICLVTSRVATLCRDLWATDIEVAVGSPASVMVRRLLQTPPSPSPPSKKRARAGEEQTDSSSPKKAKLGRGGSPRSPGGGSPGKPSGSGGGFVNLALLPEFTAPWAPTANVPTRHKFFTNTSQTHVAKRLLKRDSDDIIDKWWFPDDVVPHGAKVVSDTRERYVILPILKLASCTTLTDILELGYAIAQKLRMLHAVGVAHMDIKPSNVVGSGTSARLIDFGNAATFRMTNPVDRWGVCGTSSYVCPEARTGAAYDCRRADVFALGMTLLHFALHIGCTDATLQDIIAAATAQDPNARADGSRLCCMLAAALATARSNEGA